MASAPTWPHPSEMVSVALAAKLLACNRSSLSRQIQKVRKGNPPQTKDPRIDVVARIFVSDGIGPNLAVEAALLIKALNIPAQQVSKVAPIPPPKKAGKEIRYRVSKKERIRLRTRPAKQLEDIFKAAHGRVITRNNLNARRWLKNIIDALMECGIPFPADRVEGIPTGRFVPFTSLADWTASAGPDDCYFFFFRNGTGRPLDYLMLTVEDMEGASFRFLNIRKWFDDMRHAIDGEAAEAEEQMYRELPAGR